MKQSIIQSTQTYASEIKGKRHVLGTESCLNASDENGDKGKSLYIPYSSQQQSLYNFTIISIPRFIQLHRMYPVFVNNPEKLSAQ